MKAGPLSRRVRIEKPDGARDGFRSPNPTWTEVFEQNAQVDSISGREFFGAGRELGEVTWRITMRSHPDHVLEPSWRAVDVDNGAVYDFVSVLPSKHRDYVTIAAKSGSST